MKLMNNTYAQAVLVFIFALVLLGTDQLAANQVPPGETPASSVQDQSEQQLTGVLNRIEELNEELQAATRKLNAVLQGEQLDGVTVLIILFVGSYLVNRITSMLMVLFSSLAFWDRAFPQPNTLDAAHKRHLAAIKLLIVYYILAIVVAVGLTSTYYLCSHSRLIHVLISDLKEIDQFSDFILSFDFWITVVILVVGAEQLAQWLKLYPEQQNANTQGPVEMTGTLVVVEEPQATE